MHIKSKLHQILIRIKFLRDNVEGKNTDYKNGFNHALGLFRIAVFLEFKGAVQIDTNKAQEARELREEIGMLNMSLGNQKRYIDHLERMVKQKESIKVSNRTKKRIYRAIEEMTGQPYEYVKERFTEIIEAKNK